MLAIASKSEYNKEKGGDTMANTSAVYARIDTNLKDNAEHSFSAWHFSIQCNSDAL